MTDFSSNQVALFLGPMCWVGGGKVATDANKAGTVEITNKGRYVTWFFGCSLIGGR